MRTVVAVIIAILASALAALFAAADGALLALDSNDARLNPSLRTLVERRERPHRALAFARVLPRVTAIPDSASTRRTRFVPRSAMKRSPSGDAAIPHGVWSAAPTAGLPSPKEAARPTPATVAMLPVSEEILRTTCASASAIRRSPFGATQRPRGARSRALVARPPSPVDPGSPVPATTVTIPVTGSTRRTTCARASVT